MFVVFTVRLRIDFVSFIRSSYDLWMLWIEKGIM